MTDDGGAGSSRSATPARPYVPPSEAVRASRVERRSSPRPFSGAPTRDRDRVWPLVTIDAPAGEPTRARSRPPQRRWDAIQIEFEEWGSGSLVIVGFRPGPSEIPASDRAVDVTEPAADAPAPPQPETPHVVRIAVDIGNGDAGEIAERIATALETVALRVRVGEFHVRGIVDGMSDVALLAATLATLLAPR